MYVIISLICSIEIELRLTPCKYPSMYITGFRFHLIQIEVTFSEPDSETPNVSATSPNKHPNSAVMELPSTTGHKYILADVKVLVNEK